MAVVIFHKNLFLTPKIGFLCFAAKTIEPPWRRHTHAPKLVSPVINLYHQGLKLVQSTASALNCIYDFLGGVVPPPLSQHCLAQTYPNEGLRNFSPYNVLDFLIFSIFPGNWGKMGEK